MVALPRHFQADMTKPAPAATLGSSVIAEIVAGTDLLRRLARPGSHRSLDQFRDAFPARYEGREVPLVEALDEEAGIGFEASAETSPLLHDLAFPLLADESAPAGAREALLLRKLGELLQDVDCLVGVVRSLQACTRLLEPGQQLLGPVQ
jgi:hypothetical protein